MISIRIINLSVLFNRKNASTKSSLDSCDVALQSKIRVIGYSSVLNLGAKVIYQSETAPGSLQGYVIGKGLFWGEFQKPSSSQGKNPSINDYPILNERK